MLPLALAYRLCTAASAQLLRRTGCIQQQQNCRMTCAALFSDAQQAEFYSIHRPRYPQDLFNAVLSKCAGRSLAVDIATGSGQAASSLAPHFTKVIAQDGSAQQLQYATQQHTNVQYEQADAHCTGLPDQCAELVTVAQALHWFDIPRFYREVRRILQPKGCFAAWCYGLPNLCHEGHPANEVLWHLYEGVLGSYWAEGRRHVEQAYAGIEPVAGTDFASVNRLSFKAARSACVDDVVGLVQSWSAYQTFLKQHPGNDPIHKFRQDLMQALEAQDGSHTLDVVHTITLVLAHEPLLHGLNTTADNL